MSKHVKAILVILIMVCVFSCTIWYTNMDKVVTSTCYINHDRHYITLSKARKILSDVSSSKKYYYHKTRTYRKKKTNTLFVYEIISTTDGKEYYSETK